jgi:hypothetical protein
MAPDPDNEYVRLHITPFDKSLLDRIVPSSVQPSAKNISFHALQSFPEKGFGFVELPKMEADKIKKKLNGAILKGSKVRIEEARPEKKAVGVGEDDEKPRKRSKEEKDSKKRKRDSEAIPGVELHDRKVKRGWTTPSSDLVKEKRSKDKKDEKEEKKVVVKSKFTSGPECLFKTTLPANVAANLKNKSDALESNTEKKKKKRNGKEVLVHEFAKTTKYASFLRGSGVVGGKTAKEFVEGKGWVDENGEVIESVTLKAPRKTVQLKKPVVEDDDTSSSGDSDTSEEDSSDEDEQDVTEDKVDAATRAERASSTSSSGSSPEDEDDKVKENDAESESDSEAESIADSVSNKATPTPVSSTEISTPAVSQLNIDQAVASDTSDAMSSSEPESELATDSDSSSASEDESEAEASSASEKQEERSTSSNGPPPNLSIEIPAVKSSQEATSTEVHPLEALYKRSKDAAEAPVSNEEAAPGFSFFGGDNDDDIEMEDQDDLSAMPMTPFSQTDIERRRYRSAAPTPDTAHPGKVLNWPTEYDDEDMQYEDTTTPVRKGAKAATSEPAPEAAATSAVTDFQKWFYENRGDTNRAWKKRRKVVAKEKRQKENRKRGDR